MNILRRKSLWGALFIIVFVLGGLFIYLQNVDMRVPDAERNGSIDPATYMTADQLEKAEEYSRARYTLYFLQLPYEWLVYLGLLIFGLSARFQKWVQAAFRWSLIQFFFFLLVFTFVTTILFLPLDLYSFYLGHKYGITTQSLHSWSGDLIKSYWINLLYSSITFGVLFVLIRRSKRWWFYAWLLTIPFTLFLYFIQPILLEPLYNEFKPLQDVALKEDILALAARADIPANQVYEVDMSKKTNAMNAYVTGIGSSARIVLWDTTLQKLDREEILFVMAHEMGHYVKKHVYWNLGTYIVSSFIFFWILHKVLDRFVERFGGVWGVRSKQDFAVLPFILLLASFLSFMSSPITNAISRSNEHSSDVYALELTNQSEAAVTTFQKLSAEGLSHPNPPAIVRFFMYTHPTIVERIRFAANYEYEREATK